MSDRILLKNVLLLAFLGTAALYDVRQRRIPNRLSLAGAAAGLLWLAIFGQSGDWESSGLGFVLGAGSMLLLYAGGGVGGGDVKLAAGLGLLAGYPDIVYLMFFGCAAALAMILAELAWKGVFWSTILSGLRPWKKRRKGGGPADAEPRSVSLALALALGLAWVRIMEFA